MCQILNVIGGMQVLPCSLKYALLYALLTMSHLCGLEIMIICTLNPKQTRTRL